MHMTPTTRLPLRMLLAAVLGIALVATPHAAFAQTTDNSGFRGILDAFNDAMNDDDDDQDEDDNRGQGNGNGRGNGNGNGQENRPDETPEEPTTAPPVPPVIPDEPEDPAPTPPVEEEPEEPAEEPAEEEPVVEEDEDDDVPLTPATINRPILPPPSSGSASTLVASAGTIEAGQGAIFPYARTNRSPLAPEVLALLIAGSAALVRGFSLVRRESSVTVAPA